MLKFLIKETEVWRFYNKRATVENFIKEGIYGFGLDNVISHHYAGNYTYLELLMLAYNLMNFFKKEVLNQDKIKKMLERRWLYRTEYEEALKRVT